MDRNLAVRDWSRLVDRIQQLAPRLPLTFKLAAPIVMATIVLATAMGFIIVGQVQTQLEAAYDTQTQAIATGVEVMVLQHPDDLQQMNSYLARLLKTSPELSTVRIHGLDSDATVIASSNTSEVGQTGLLDAEELHAIWSGSTLEVVRGSNLITVVPLREQDFIWGAIVITSSNAAERAAAGTLKFDIGLAVVASIVFEIVLVLTPTYFAILRRSRRLQRAVEAVEAGDTSVRLPEGQEPPGRDELFNLARRIDHMIVRIDERRRQDALIRGLNQRALEGTPPARLVAEGLEATREAFGLERCIFATINENGGVVCTVDNTGASAQAAAVPVWVGALASVAVAARKPVLTDRLGQHSRFVESTQDSAAQAVIVPLPRKSKAGEAIVAIAPAGQSIRAGSLAVLDAVASTFAETLHMQEAEEARAESTVKSRVMAAVSHEMRNPLNSILGFTALVLTSSKEPLTEKQRRQLGYVQTSATNMLNLVNNYLDLAKTRSGSLHIQPESVRVAPILEEVVELAQPAAGSRNVTIRSSVDPQSTARLDPSRVRQVLTNLVSNAVKFTPPGGRVFVRARVDGRACRFVVSDTGVGIPRDQRSLVFTEFAKINAGAMSGGKGTGLGLALTRAIVEAMGGTIRFHSRQGRGTTFVVLLPGASGEVRTEAA